MRILHLFVKEKYWNQVLNEQKKEEYRLVKPYWTKKLKKKYDLIHYHKGYNKEHMVFKYKGWRTKIIRHEIFGKEPVMVYVIPLIPRGNK